jgi:hypothetical protein
MPTVLREKGYGFFFYMADQYEPPHIHVAKQANAAKFWLDPLELAFNDGFREHELSEIRRIIKAHTWTSCLQHGMSCLGESFRMTELRIKKLRFANGQIVVSLTDAKQLRIGLQNFPRLQSASPKQRNQWQLIGRGRGVHWPAVDEDLSVENFLTAYSRSQSRRVPATIK